VNKPRPALRTELHNRAAPDLFNDAFLIEKNLNLSEAARNLER